MTGIIGHFSGTLSTSRDMVERIKSRGVSWTLTKPYTREDLSAHFTLRDAILNAAYREGRITETQFHQVNDFGVNYEDQLIEFTIPGTKHEVAISFESVTDPSAVRALNYLIGRANTELFYGHAVPIVGSSKAKSNANGPQPLQRKSTAAKALTSSFDEAKQTLLPALLAQTPDVASCRQKVVKRLEHAEFVAHRMQRELTLKIQVKEREVQQLETTRPQPEDAGRRIAVLKGEIRELKKLLKKFETLDVYALTVALTALPVGRYHYDQLEGATQLVQRQVRSDLEGRLPKSRIPFRKSSLDQTDEAYIKGVAGLLHKSRGEYATYCKKQGMNPESESLEDLVLREALRVSDKRDFSEGEISGAASLSSMTPALQTEVTGMFDYLDRLSGVKSYFPDETRTYMGADSSALAGQIASRSNSVNMNGMNAPARQHRVFNPRNLVGALGVGGAIVVADRLGLEPVRRIQEVGQMALSSPAATVGNLFMAYTGVNHLRRWTSQTDQLPSLLMGGSALAGIAMYALGTMDPSELYQLAVANPQYTVALLATAQAVTRTAYDYVCPEIEPVTGPYNPVNKRRINWNRVLGVAVVGTALTYGLVNLYQAMYSEDEDERNQAVGFLSGAVDQVWNHCIIAGIALPMVRNVIQSRVGGTVGKATSKVLEIFETVAKVGQTYHFAVGAWNKVSGYFSSAPTPSVLALPSPETNGSVVDLDTSPRVEELTEDGPVPLLPLSPSRVSLNSTSEVDYFLHGHPVCPTEEVVEQTATKFSLFGKICVALGTALWNSTSVISKAYNEAAKQGPISLL